MKSEIDNNHFCGSHTDPNNCHGFDSKYSNGCFRQSKSSSMRTSKKLPYCKYCHRKHPTPEQFKEEYGRDVSKWMPVWIALYNGPWKLDYFYRYTQLSSMGDEVYCVIACTPLEAPDDNWRPV